MANSKAYSINDEDFDQLIKNSTSYLEVALSLGYTKNGRHSYDLIKKRCAELNISTEHFIRKSGNNIVYENLDDVLIENSPYSNLTSLKNRLLKEKRLEYKCAICGNIGVWNNQKLSLQLDHINGNHKDNRIENLRMLCPNCHSQTETFGSRQPRAKSND